MRPAGLQDPRQWHRRRSWGLCRAFRGYRPTNVRGDRPKDVLRARQFAGPDTNARLRLSRDRIPSAAFGPGAVNHVARPTGGGLAIRDSFQRQMVRPYTIRFRVNLRFQMRPVQLLAHRRITLLVFFFVSRLGFTTMSGRLRQGLADPLGPLYNFMRNRWPPIPEACERECANGLISNLDRRLFPFKCRATRKWPGSFCDPRARTGYGPQDSGHDQVNRSSLLWTAVARDPAGPLGTTPRTGRGGRLVFDSFPPGPCCGRRKCCTL